MTMIIEDLETGYFADPEAPQAPFPPVHAITPDKKPLCGEEIREGEEYQWSARKLWWDYLDCKACKGLVYEMAASQGLISKDQIPSRARRRLLWR